MFKKTVLISTVVALFVVTGNARGMHHGKNRGHNSNATSYQSQNIDISNIPLSELTDTQKEDLLFMVEEEKVARDVYAYLYDVWGSRVFGNIKKSEQRHMDAIETLLNRYNLETPLTLDNQGIFENAELQSLYDTLIAKGNSSLIDALEVGVIIEETDIADLENILKAGVPADFETTYQNLLEGSYKHLNAFNRQLAKE